MEKSRDEMISTILSIVGTQSITEQFIEMVLGRLESLSCVLQDNDGWLIGFTIGKVANQIISSCNTTTIPEGLENIAVDMICGEIMMNLKQVGRLDESFNLECAVEQIQAGDTNVRFAVGSSQSPEQRLNQLISYLMESGKGQFTCYRKIKW